eukprot:TRINITY_DN17231_c0_g1_i1.p1 TRINITY_DN17231_c0_g1~~TRINITY_DN17231_c0_g1_i1.p1  ORF type:complete len:107 (+),score=31.13 TRINITY_DN17231_c0_g1_i1:105-425(+)
MIRRPPRSTHCISSAASDVYKRQDIFNTKIQSVEEVEKLTKIQILDGIIHSKYKESMPTLKSPNSGIAESFRLLKANLRNILETSAHVLCVDTCLLYTSPSPRDQA